MNRILTIVVTYNGMRWADRCFGSLSMSGVPTDVIAIDNGSTDGTPEYISENFPQVKIVATGVNHGFGRANNIGLRYALEHGYEYVYLLNQDAWIFPDTFGTLIEAMEADRSYGIMSPMQMAACIDRPDPRFERWCPKAALRDVDSRFRKGKVYGVKFVMAAHWMISRECLENVGGFSPAFTHYGEDDNLVHRAIYKGYRIGIHSGTKAVHDREMRPMSKQASMRLKCVASVVKLSNPLNKLWLRMLFQPIELLAISIRYRSGYVFMNIFTLIRSYRHLKAIRKESLDDMAFLRQ
jgi:GT2 family glycosyltransferase